MKVTIERPIGGISLNGNEFLLDEDNNPMEFENKQAAFDFLKANGYDGFSDEILENLFIFNETNLHRK
jgi:hypothetical protein